MGNIIVTSNNEIFKPVLKEKKKEKKERKNEQTKTNKVVKIIKKVQVQN